MCVWDFCAERDRYRFVRYLMSIGSSARSASLTHSGMTSFGVRGSV